MALKYLRDNLKHLKWVLWFVVIVFVLLVFVDWGAGRQEGRVEREAVRVGENVFTEREFLEEVRATETRFRSIYGEQWDQVRDQVNMGEQTAQRLIQRTLLAGEAERAGLVVSRAELQDYILSLPAFQREDGTFVGEDLYARILRSNQMTPQAFERNLEVDLKIQKLRSVLANGVYVSAAEAEATLRREREAADVDAVHLLYQSFLGEVEVAPDEVEAYYRDNQEEFTRDEERSIRYLLVDTSALRRLLPVEDSDLEAYFEEHRGEFLEGERAWARHILFRVPRGAGEAEDAEAKLRADGVARIARAGADFAALAEQHSEDPGSGSKGGDLGWFGRGQMVDEFEQAVFGHKPGDIVGPVKSQFGYHVIKVEDLQPERQRPLEEVREQVRFSFLEGRAGTEAEARCAELGRRLRAERPKDEAEWQAIAEEDEAVTLNLSPAFGRDEVIPGVGEDEALAADVFSAEPGKINEPRQMVRGWMVWELAEVQEAGVPPLEEIRDRVTVRTRHEAAVERAEERGRELATQWRAGTEAELLAEELGTSVVAIRDHGRGSAFAGIGVSSPLDDAIFTATEGAVIGPVHAGDRGVVVGRISRLVKLTPGAVAAEVESTHERLVGEQVERLLGSIIGERQRETVITVDSELVERFAPRSAGG